MISYFLDTIICLNLIASASYILLRVLTFICKKHISQNWRYGCTTVILFLYVLPFYHLLPKLTKIIPKQDLLNNIGNNILVGMNILSHESFSENIPNTSTQLGEQLHANIHFDYQILIFTIWLIVLCFLLLRSILGLAYFRHQLSKSQTVNCAKLQMIANQCSTELGLNQPVCLKCHPKAQAPMLVGFFKPIIIIPSTTLSLDDAQMMLMHELVHFKHRDLWRKFFAFFIQTVYWFNPIVYLIKADLEHLAETSCDEQVVMKMDKTQRKKYGHLLISYATVFNGQCKLSGIAFITTQKKLERRILTMLNSNKKSRKVATIALTGVLCAGCLSMSAFAANNDSNIDVSNAKLINVGDVNTQNMEEARIADSENNLIDLSTLKLSTNSDEFAKEVQSTATFANLSDFNLSTEKADGLTFFEGTLTAKAGEAVPYASGNLSGGKGYSFDAQDLVKGQKVTVNASWTPENATVQIGLINNNTGVGLVKTVSGGEGSASFEVTGNSNFSIFIGNISSSSIHFDVSYMVN